GDESFYVLNADIVWTDGPEDSALRRLAAAWDPSRMDLLLLLHPVRDLPAYNGIGDYYLAPGDDRPVSAKNGAVPGVEANCIFAGPRIVHPRLFAGEKPGHFSFLDLFHKAEKAGRLAALVHDGAWHHVGTPEALEKT